LEAYRELLVRDFRVGGGIIDLVEEAERGLADGFAAMDRVAAHNQAKVLAAFQKNRVSDRDFGWNTGYGYDDPGRKALSGVFADVFRAEAALARPLIVNGTHAISLALFGVLRPGDEVVYCSGAPYDTLRGVIGLNGRGGGSLADFGVSYRQVELDGEGRIDKEGLAAAITPATRMACLQRSTGYGWRKALTVADVAEWASFMKGLKSDIVLMVDNCYGEFLETAEPIEAGADLIAGSLIKNPGGGLALTGGYVAGRADLLEAVAYRMTCPGIGDECGLTFGQSRAMLQGLFLAPVTVAAALKGAMLCAAVFDGLGYDVCPRPSEARSDIIQGVRLGSPEAVVAFCEGVQAAAPVDAHVKPAPWDMPGYEDRVIMAAGAFVQGSSIELSADAPMRPPYNAYFQGGLTYEHSKMGVLMALRALEEKGLLRGRG
jgi:cystathionine beta-lyase family protein involved in aluminum resistance